MKRRQRPKKDALKRLSVTTVSMAQAMGARNAEVEPLYRQILKKAQRATDPEQHRQGARAAAALATLAEQRGERAEALRLLWRALTLAARPVVRKPLPNQLARDLFKRLEGQLGSPAALLDFLEREVLDASKLPSQAELRLAGGLLDDMGRSQTDLTLEVRALVLSGRASWRRADYTAASARWHKAAKRFVAAGAPSPHLRSIVADGLRRCVLAARELGKPQHRCDRELGAQLAVAASTRSAA